MTETTDSRRLALVAAAQQQWIAALTDLGGRNTLLYYKDRRAGTLDLADADPEALEKFLRTGNIKLTRLFKDADIRADAIRRMQAIYRKARELLEERGIRAGYLATGLARWDELFLEPAAPVLLRGLSVTPTRARYDDFDLTLEDEEEVNPVLLHKLSAVFGAQLENISPERAVAQLTKAAVSAEIPGFEVLDRRVIGTFTYAKLPMVRDMEAASDLLAECDLVAAIAGDPEAQEAVAGDGPMIAAVSDTPDEDYSVLDADSSQRAAIDTVLAGQSLVIHGPPGTGKSQTIANLIAALVARGRKVLFVAEKRAAIDAVLSRLSLAELGDIVLDIHEGTRDRMRIAKDLGATLDLARQSVPAETARVRRRLADRVQRLRRHADALHETHEPWDLSAYDVQSALLGIPVEARTSVRLPGVERIGASTAELVRDDLRVFAHLGGFTLRPSSTPWFGALIRDSSEARQAAALAATLASDTLPRLTHRMGKACADLGLRRPNDYAGQAAVMRLFAAVSQTSRVLDTAVWAASPAELAAACAPDRAAASAGPRLGMVERHRLRGRARELWLGPDKPSTEDLYAALSAAAHQLKTWRELGGETPGLPTGYEQLTELFAETNRQLGGLRAILPGELDANLEASVKALAEDQDTPWKLPRLYDLAQQFERLGLHPLLDELARAEASADLATHTFDHAWYASILDRIRERDPGYAAERGGALDEIASDFRERDVEHLAANRSRVRRSWAKMTRDAEDRHPLQARVLRKQAALRRGHLPLRRLLDQTGDVLFAMKPCWAMSPLMVSQVLPAARLFDVVIFDEASQIVPADAISSIIRAHQVVVAGDDHQLPPTSFFRQSVASDEEDEDDDLVSFDTGFESVLDALRPLLPTAPLNWHYRSRDERLVAFSNDRIYGGALTTFPGVLTGDCLVHEVVASVDDEVTRVVELILEHARKRPAESLGVIALGMRHAERIDVALRAALANAPLAVESFFAEDAPSPFFIKNLERVQGDERDAIILSVGYGKHSDGRMRYQWGPLLRDGGERRLNVAATRAKHRLTLVSSFSAHDVDPSRVTKAGARMLAEYLDYAGSGGVPVSASGSSGDLDSFAESVRTRLADYGITVVPSYGVGGYRVDFAFAHPDDPSRMILAVEADGASYRDSGSVRDRDRLRKEHLERLGWRYRRLWSTNWFHDPEGEAARLREAYEKAVAESPPLDDEDEPEGPQPEQSPEPKRAAPEPDAPERPPAAPHDAQLPPARRRAIPMPGGPPAAQLPGTRPRQLPAPAPRPESR
ncbi:MAG TPA: AAA domain-containing protein [Streptosporangiaceae bacterium]|nr:AAA domain-containing protein [Streptosporangiaceae bacterium]